MRRSVVGFVAVGIGLGCAPRDVQAPTVDVRDGVRVEVATSPTPPARRKLQARRPPRRPHPEMVAIRTSLIPGAGQGLFATVDIPEETYIGFYQGRKLKPGASAALGGTKAGEYLFTIPACAEDEDHDTIAGDMKHYVSKVNFAPATINGQATNLQNTEFRGHCSEPHVRLYSSRDIAAGEELYVDYGPRYGYDFMESPEVQQYLLQATGIEAQAEFSWDHDGESEE